MGDFKFQIGFIAVLAIVSLFYLPVYLLRRKMQRMSEDDLKKISLEDWKNQIKSNAYTRLIMLNLWGLILIGSLIYNYRIIMENGIDLITALIFAVALAYMFAGFLVCRMEMKKLQLEN